MSCEDVAINAPLASVVIIEFLAPVKDVPFIVMVVKVPESEAVTPEPTKFNVVCAGKSLPSS